MANKSKKTGRTKAIAEMIGKSKLTGNLQGKQRKLFPVQDDVGGKQTRRAEEATDTVIKMSRSNPLSYYTKFTRFAEDAARLPFANPLGTPLTFTSSVNNTYKLSVPGIMRIEFTPCPGIATDFNSPLNRSSTRFYTYLRSNQKASANYDHQDITMMEMALDSAYMFHAMCTRIYGIAQNISPVNEYYARAMVAAAHVNYQDLRRNLQDFRQWINVFAYNLGQFSLPQGITLFDRHRWMCEGYYTDGESTRAQTYLFVPTGFWKYNNTISTGSQLDFIDFVNSSETFTVQQLMDFGDSLLNAFAGDEDFQVIAGDIYNFYGGQVYTVPYLNENYRVLPIYDKTVLSQIENLTVVGTLTNNVISQNPNVNQGAIIYNPTPSSVSYLGDIAPMNFHWDSPTPGEVIEASRLTVALKTTTVDGTATTQILSCGTELVNKLTIFRVNPVTGGSQPLDVPRQQTVLTGQSTNTGLRGLINTLITMSQFDWSPYVLMLNGGSSADPTPDVYGFTWDIEVIDFVPFNYLTTIHTACLYSLFEIGTNRIDLS